MQLRPARRALTLAVIAVLAAAGVASADSVRADGDLVTPGAQTTVDLGSVAPSALITPDVAFLLLCGNGSHVDPGQAVTLTFWTGTAPEDGAILDVTTGSTATAPEDWTPDGEFCPIPAPTIEGGTPSTVTLRAPSTPGTGYTYTVAWTASVSEPGNDDAAALRAGPAVTFELEVVGNTAPVLSLPGDLTIEGDSVGGWTAAWSSVSAADAEDDPDPVPTCSPAVGEVLPLGTTTVSCSVTDSGGLDDSGTFDVTVVDTTAPTLIGQPGDIDLVTGDPAGAVLDYPLPTASDAVDASPAVACAPAGGSTVGVGTTTVTCTATDASGNAASASFDVRVAHVPTSSASAVWGEPIGAATTFVANRGRTIPVKVTLFVDGTARTSGDARLSVAPCGGGAATVSPMAFSGGRWTASLDTRGLVGACHVVSASIDGMVAGSFDLELRGLEAAKARGAAAGRSR